MFDYIDSNKYLRDISLFNPLGNPVRSATVIPISDEETEWRI